MAEQKPDEMGGQMGDLAPQRPMEQEDDACYVALTLDDIDVTATMDRVRSNQAGAIVLFAGTTRDNFAGRPVTELRYTTYVALACKTMFAICKSIKRKYSLISIAMVHRFGIVPIGKESIVIVVSSPHRKAAFQSGEEALEECKRQVEVWKKEWFPDMADGVWRSNFEKGTGMQTPPE